MAMAALQSNRSLHKGPKVLTMVEQAGEIVDYYEALAQQNPGKCVYHPPSEGAK